MSDPFVCVLDDDGYAGPFEPSSITELTEPTIPEDVRSLFTDTFSCGMTMEVESDGLRELFGELAGEPYPQELHIRRRVMVPPRKTHVWQYRSTRKGRRRYVKSGRIHESAPMPVEVEMVFRGELTGHMTDHGTAVMRFRADAWTD